MMQNAANWAFLSFLSGLWGEPPMILVLQSPAVLALREAKLSPKVEICQIGRVLDAYSLAVICKMVGDGPLRLLAILYDLL